MFEQAKNKIILDEKAPIGIRPAEDGCEVLLGDHLIRLNDHQAQSFLATLTVLYGRQLPLPLVEGPGTSVRDLAMLQQEIRRTGARVVVEPKYRTAEEQEKLFGELRRTIPHDFAPKFPGLEEFAGQSRRATPAFNRGEFPKTNPHDQKTWKKRRKSR